MSLKFQYYGHRVSEGGLCHPFFTFLPFRVPEGVMCHWNFNIMVLGFPREDCVTHSLIFLAFGVSEEGMCH